MNVDKLKQKEEEFLFVYPGGFSNPAMEEILKKHKMDLRIKQAKEFFNKTAFNDSIDIVCERIIKLVSQSSMISVFEKPKFKDTVRIMSSGQKHELVDGLKVFLHAKNQQLGFNKMLDVFKQFKLAKWSLMTIIPNYYHPNDEVFLKPTTVKGIIEYFELEELKYKPQPSWDFYEKYREQILEMKAKVDPSLTSSNAAFCGFLMISIK